MILYVMWRETAIIIMIKKPYKSILQRLYLTFCSDNFVNRMLSFWCLTNCFADKDKTIVLNDHMSISSQRSMVQITQQFRSFNKLHVVHIYDLSTFNNVKKLQTDGQSLNTPLSIKLLYFFGTSIKIAFKLVDK